MIGIYVFMWCYGEGGGGGGGDGRWNRIINLRFAPQKHTTLQFIYASVICHKKDSY